MVSLASQGVLSGLQQPLGRSSDDFPATTPTSGTQNSTQRYLERKNFGQRIVANSSGPSLLARAIRQLNATLLGAGKRDYEATSLATGGSSSQPGRPNLSLDTWARLMNRHMNMTRTTRGPQVANSTAGPLTPGALRRAASSGQLVASSLPLMDSAQETLSIGIVIRPDEQRSVNVTGGGVHNSTTTMGSGDWQTAADTNEIESVIRLAADGDHQDELRGHAKAGEQLRGHEEAGKWSRSRHGEQQEAGEANKAGQQADKRLVDQGHNRHGWKNVYHREEYAQHQKYHDVLHDKDWHERQAKAKQQLNYLKGNKFNQSNSDEFHDVDKHGSNYDYRKGSEWKRSEEDSALGDSTAATSDDLSQRYRPLQSAASQPYQAANSTGESVQSLMATTPVMEEQSKDEDSLDDDEAVLEQMKARLDRLSERAHQRSSAAARTAKPPAEYEQQQQSARSWASASRPASTGPTKTGHVLHENINDVLKSARNLNSREVNGTRREPDEQEGDDDDDDSASGGEQANDSGGEQQQQQHRLDRSAAVKSMLAEPIRLTTDNNNNRDKRNELRLKLELDLGKAASPEGYERQPSRHLAKVAGAISSGRKNANQTSMTNSLGHSVGSATGFASRPPRDPSQQAAPTSTTRRPAASGVQGQHRNSSHQSNSASGWLPRGTTNGSALAQVLPSRPIFVKHLQMNGGIVLGPQPAFNMSTEDEIASTNHLMGQPHLVMGSHQTGVEDLTVETAHGAPHPMEAAAFEALLQQSQQVHEDNQPTKDYMLVFGGIDHHSAAASEQASRHQHFRHHRQHDALEDSNPGEPKVIFEASASTMDDDRLPGVFGQQEADQTPVLEAHRHQQAQANELVEQMNDDFSMATFQHLNPPEGHLAGPQSVQEEQQQLAASSTSLRHQFEDDEQLGNIRLASYSNEPLFGQTTTSGQQFQQVSPSRFNTAAPRPMMASLRDHLLRAASLNYASYLLSPLAGEQTGFGGSPASSGQPSTLGRWLRLPRVFDTGQQQHKRPALQGPQPVYASASRLRPLVLSGGVDVIPVNRFLVQPDQSMERLVGHSMTARPPAGPPASFEYEDLMEAASKVVTRTAAPPGAPRPSGLSNHLPPPPPPVLPVASVAPHRNDTGGNLRSTKLKANKKRKPRKNSTRKHRQLLLADETLPDRLHNKKQVMSFRSTKGAPPLAVNLTQPVRQVPVATQAAPVRPRQQPVVSNASHALGNRKALRPVVGPVDPLAISANHLRERPVGIQQQQRPQLNKKLPSILPAFGQRILDTFKSRFNQV